MTELANDAVIRVRDLVVGFAGAAPVLDRLSLDVFRGEILGFVGASGAGKSVLLRSILGLQRPVAGTVRLNGEDVTRAGPAVRPVSPYDWEK